MATLEQQKQFGRMNAGYTSIMPHVQDKPTNGSLYIDGYLHLYNLPFALLQAKKSELIRKGFNRDRLKIKYK